MRTTSFCSMALALLAISADATPDESCGSLGRPNPAKRAAPIVALLGGGSDYEDKRVGVVGVLWTERLGDSLCLTAEHSRRGIGSNCLQLSFEMDRLGGKEEEVRRVLELWNGEYVHVEGVLFSRSGSLRRLCRRAEIRVVCCAPGSCCQPGILHRISWSTNGSELSARLLRQVQTSASLRNLPGVPS